MGLGNEDSNSTLDVSNLQNAGRTYILTDSSFLLFPSKKGATSMWAYLQGQAGWSNVVVNSMMGATIADFTKWLEAIMFRHGAGPEWWRGQATGDGS